MNRRDFLKVSSTSIIGLSLAGYAAARLIQDYPSSDRSTAPHGAANVLFIVMDTVRTTSMSLYGYSRKTTPNIDQLAQSGVVFNRAIAPAPWTLPSHASMFTGYHPFELSADFHRPLDKARPTLAEAFRDAGYATAGFIANTIYCSKEYGLSRGFEHYEDYRITPGQAFLSTAVGKTMFEHWNLASLVETYQNFGNKSAELIRESYLNWLDERNQEKPFFAFLNFFDAHKPYLPSPEFQKIFSGNDQIVRLPKNIEKTLDPSIMKSLNDSYDACIAYIDEQIGIIYRELDRKGLLDNTLIVITSDHGEHLGEHRLLGHANSLYMTLLHVPLVFLFPPVVPAGAAINTPVSLRDLAATLVAFTELKTSIKFPGISMHNYINKPMDSTIQRSEANIDVTPPDGKKIHGRMISLVRENLHYIRYPNQAEELFDITNDPGELDDISKSLGNKKVIKSFRSQI